MLTASFRSCSFPLAALCALAAGAEAQNCTGTIQANLTQISISTGGVQQIDLTVAPSQVDLMWQVVGAYGTNDPIPFLAYGGLRLNNDRYLFRTYCGQPGFIQGGIDGYMGGLVVPFDAQGQAQLQVVIPPGLPSSWIGTTLHHGMYRQTVDLVPVCGTGTVPLLLTP